MTDENESSATLLTRSDASRVTHANHAPEWAIRHSENELGVDDEVGNEVPSPPSSMAPPARDRTVEPVANTIQEP